MVVELLSRLQFAVTVAFHFIFPPLSIGLGLMLTVIEWKGWKNNDQDYVRLGKFFSKLFAITFAIGVGSGLVMVLQFGTNWARYSAFVGDVFGAPLAAEAVFAFFLESTFLGLYLFGRNKISKPLHWFSILMVTFGATISAFWIIIANSWQQTPAGHSIQNLSTGQVSPAVPFMYYDPALFRAVLTDFWGAVFNPSTLIRYFHTVLAAFVSGAFAMAGTCAYLILKKKDTEAAHKGLKVALVFALIFSVLQLFPSGHDHARQVANTQPEKFAAIQGLYSEADGAPIVIFGVPATELPPSLKVKFEIPGLLGWLATGNPSHKFKTISDFPKENVPPLWLTFVSYHNMVALGMIFIILSVWGAVQMKRKKLLESKKLLRLLVIAIPLPVIACQLGWMAAEIGRQPWIVYGLLKTKDAFSTTVPAGQIWFTFILFSVIYLLMTILYVYLISREIKKGLAPEEVKA